MPRKSPFILQLPLMNVGNWNPSPVNIRHRIVMSFAPESFSWRPRASPTTSSLLASTRRVRSSANGVNDSLWPAFPASRVNPEAGVRPAFPPSLVVQVKALACELPHRLGLPLSRFSVEDIRQQVLAQGLVAQISGATIWRWLSRDALCPWRHRTWIFPRDPRFVEKAGPILDLYQGLWEGQPLGPGDFVLSADEKTSIQARRRIHASRPPAPGRPTLVEHEYERRGAWAYLAAWDVHRAKIFGRCETTTGIAPFDRLVEDVMGQEPYRSASPRVLDLRQRVLSPRPKSRSAPAHPAGPPSFPSTRRSTPVGSTKSKSTSPSFSAKSLLPCDFACLADLEAALLAFQYRYEKSAAPFRWTFTRAHLAALMQRLKASALPAAA